MQRQTHRVNSVAELDSVAKEFLQAYPQPGIFLVNGQMGAGKTTFIRHVCAVLGIDEAASPTFSLVNEYRSPSGLAVYHFDLYRIKTLDEALDMGIEEYLNANAYVFIEWPEKILPLLGSYHTIDITDNNGIRSIVF